VALVVNAPVLCEPLVAFAPANVPPVPVHDVALVELQVSVEAAPLVTEVGDAEIDAVGGAVAVAAGAPDPPPQAARSSAAAVDVTGAKLRVRICSSFRIILGRRAI
jgi:hypothetical protein